MSVLQEYFTNKVLQNQEKMYINLITQLLGHAWTMNDFKRFTRVMLPGDDHLNYDVAFDGVKVGRFETVQDGNTVTTTFHPLKK